MNSRRLLQLADQLLPVPSAEDHKYTRGVVGFVTGGQDFPGAALLGVSAALGCPVGMVRYVGPLSVSDLVVLEHPEVVVTQAAAGAGHCNAWVLGSGVAATDQAQIQNLQQVLKLQPVAVVDAQALEQIDFTSAAAVGSKLLLTPHLGEARRLANRLGLDPQVFQDGTDESVALATALCRATGQTVLLKGSVTVLVAPGGVTRLIGPNSPHLATAGTGDVLAGILGALAAIQQASHNAQNQPFDWLDIAELAVLLHSEAAQLVAKTQVVTASAVSRALPGLVRNLQESA